MKLDQVIKEFTKAVNNVCELPCTPVQKYSYTILMMFEVFNLVMDVAEELGKINKNIRADLIEEFNKEFEKFDLLVVDKRKIQ